MRAITVLQSRMMTVKARSVWFDSGRLRMNVNNGGEHRMDKDKVGDKNGLVPLLLRETVLTNEQVAKILALAERLPNA